MDAVLAWASMTNGKVFRNTKDAFQGGASIAAAVEENKSLLNDVKVIADIVLWFVEVKGVVDVGGEKRQRLLGQAHAWASG